MKIYNGKKLGAIALAVLLGFNGAALTNNLSAKAETKATFTIQKQKQNDEKTMMSKEEYLDVLQRTGDHLVQFDSYENMAADSANYVYVKNIAHIDKDLEKELISEGYILDVNGSEDLIWLLFDSCERLAGTVLDYNEQTIKKMYEKNKINSKKLINLSVACFDKDDKAAEDQVFNNWVKAYSSGLYESEAFLDAFKQLTNLSAPQQGRNNTDNSVGQRYSMLYFNGNMVLEMLNVYAYDKDHGKWTAKELSKYFDIFGSTIIPKKDVTPDLKGLKEGSKEYKLAKFARYYFDLYYCVYKTVYNDIFNYMGARCTEKTK